MKLKYLLALLFGLIIHLNLLKAQNLRSKKVVFYSRNAMFPDGLKSLKDSKYTDSTTLILIPKSFNKNAPFQLFFWFHGWGNNITQTLESFKLEEELIASGINAILILPEAAKNANDSYAGKWEKEAVFNTYFTELTDFLSQKDVINTQQPHSIILGGHSGAANVLTRLMQYASQHVKGVLLFDAISYETEKIAQFLQQSTTTNFINLYSPSKGFTNNSNNLIKALEKRKLSYQLKADTQFSISDIKQSRILILSTQLHHNDVATTNHYISKFLKAIDSN